MRRVIALGLAALLSILIFSVSVAPASAQIVLPARTGFSLGGSYYSSSSSNPTYSYNSHTWYAAATYSRMMSPTWDLFLTYGGYRSNTRYTYTSGDVYNYSYAQDTLTVGGRLHLGNGTSGFDPYVFGGVSYWSYRSSTVSTPAGGSPTTTASNSLSGPGALGGVGASLQLSPKLTLFGNVYGYYYSMSGTQTTATGTNAIAQSRFSYGTELGASYRIRENLDVYAMVLSGWPASATVGFTWSP